MRTPLVLTAALSIACSSSGGTAEGYGVPADSTCDFVRINAHPQPEPLSREFVERDQRGEFTGSTDWFNSAVSCPGHEPGPDAVTVVRGHKLRILTRMADTVRAEVVWDRVGYGGYGADAHDAGTDYDTLTAARTAFGWRIVSPALDPHELIKPPSP